jgi:hypothetical protein
VQQFGLVKMLLDDGDLSTAVGEQYAGVNYRTWRRMDFVNLWIVHYLVMADGGYITHRGPTLVRWSIKSRFSRPNGSAIFWRNSRRHWGVLSESRRHGSLFSPLDGNLGEVEMRLDSDRE